MDREGSPWFIAPFMPSVAAESEPCEQQKKGESKAKQSKEAKTHIIMSARICALVTCRVGGAATIACERTAGTQAHAEMTHSTQTCTPQRHNFVNEQVHIPPLQCPCCSAPFPHSTPIAPFSGEMHDDPQQAQRYAQCPPTSLIGPCSCRSSHEGLQHTGIHSSLR